MMYQCISNDLTKFKDRKTAIMLFGKLEDILKPKLPQYLNTKGYNQKVLSMFTYSTETQTITAYIV